ncbi:MAG: hypothetical protein BWK79_03425 [Beggiatoa sp. IS2]|nr:MAG: hypothetical protein BWK79_03425 [Beggiatoa sp. IS2]
MKILFLVAIIVIMLSIVIGLVQILRGIATTDHLLLAIPLFSASTVAMLLLLAETLVLPMLQDVAWLFALLAIIISVIFIKMIPS